MTDHFSVIDGVITPHPWMQERLVTSGAAVSVSRNYSPSGGGNKDDLVQSVSVKWTNNTPEAQWVEAEVSRGGSQVTLQARSRGYLADFHGMLVTETPTPTPEADDFDMVEVSRAGIGMDAGRGGLLAVGTGFCVAEKREYPVTVPFMPHSPGLVRVESGETLWCRVDVRFRSEFWENTGIDGGSSSTESGFISGDTRIDLYATPAIVDPGPRPVPTIVGVEHDTEVSGLLGEVPTEVAVPAGTAEGDVILAVPANQFGLISDIEPVESGWTQIHARDAGWQDVHLRLFWRVATDDEPETYSFTNGLAAEQITHLITLRDASLLLDDGWYVASTMRRYWWERDDGHIAPSIERDGQLLLCLSYLAHALSQSPIVQTPPAGMTEISDVSGAASAMSVSAMASPPRPTGARMFVPSKTPAWSGRSICLTILVPGTKPT